MRREYKPRFPVVKLINSMMWKRCKKCGCEFKNEYGHRIEDVFANSNIIAKYLCSSCAPNYEEAYRIAIEEKYPPKSDFIPPSQNL